MSLHFFESEFKMPAKMVVLPVRSTVIKTSTGVVIISPIKFTPKQYEEIDSLGTVIDIVSPSLFHHVYIPKTAERYANANVWGPKGCQEKLPHIKWGKLFDRDQWTHQNEIEILALAGTSKVNEVLFFEKSTKSLIVTDLLFNLMNPKGWAAPVILRIMGTYKKFAISQLFLKTVTDRLAFESSLKVAFEWDFKQIVMAHGNIVDSDAKNKFAKALQAHKIIF